MAEDRTHFDSEVRKIVMKKNGDEVTAELFWGITAALGEDVASLIDAVEASNKAGEERHADTLKKFAIHVDQDAQHRRDQAKLCAETHADLLEKMTRREPRRATDPADAMFADMGRSLADPVDSEFLEKRESAHPALRPDEERSLVQLLRLWMAGKKAGTKALVIVATVLLTLAVGSLYAYGTAYFAADRAEKAGIEVEKTALPAPTVTVTASPSSK